MTPSEELLSAYLDDELGAQDRADVERRLASDSQWRDTLEKLQEVRSWMQELPTVVPNRPKSITQMLAEHKPTAPEADVRLNDSATLSSAPTSWKWMMALAATGLVAIASTFWWMSGMNQQIAWGPGLKGPSLKGPASAAPSSAAPASSAQAKSAPDSAARTEDNTMDASASGVAAESATEAAAGAVALGRIQPKVVENAPKPDEPLPPQAMADSASARGIGGLAPSPKGPPGAAEGLDGAVEGPQVLNDPAPMRASRAGERRIRNAPSGLGSSDSVAGGMGAGGMGAGGAGAGGAGELNTGELAAGGVGVTGGMLGGSSSQPSVPTISRFLSEKSNAAESSLFFLATPYSNDEKPLLLEPAAAADAASMVSPDTLAKAADAEANGSMIEEMIYLVVPAEAFEDLEKNWKPGISESPSQNQLAQEAPLGTSKDSGLGKNEEELKLFGKPNDVWLLEMSPENYEALRLRWSESGFDVTEILDDRKLMLARRGAVTGLGAQAAEGAQAPQPSGTAKQPEASVGAAQPDFIFILLQRR